MPSEVEGETYEDESPSRPRPTSPTNHYTNNTGPEMDNEDNEETKFTTPYGEAELTEIRRKLTEWIDGHQKLCKFHVLATDLLYVPLTLQAISIFIATWLLAFNIAEEAISFRDKAVQAFYFLSNFTYFWYSCTRCDIIYEETSCLYGDAMATNWTVLPLELKKSLLMIILRCRRPFTFDVFKIFRIGNELYTKIIKSGFAVLNFLLAVKERQHQHGSP